MPKLFKSFFMGGFECATGFNKHHEWIDQVCATQHDQHVDEDYALLRKAGILTAREAVRWPVVDQQGKYDFSSLDPMLQAARRHGIELIYDLWHYGFPPDLDLFSDQMVDRFTSYCYNAAQHIATNADGPFYFTPVNEPSFLAYSAGEACLFAPHYCGRAYELKLWLTKAAIKGTEAIWSVIPDARIVTVDPVCRVATPHDRPDLQDDVDKFNNTAVFECLDMLSGRLHPELGGSRKHLDIIGINYYWTCQWEHGTPEHPLHPCDPRYNRLSDLVKTVHDRYGGEICIAETSHVDEHRSDWLYSVLEDVERIMDEEIPLLGVCLYPVLGMPEWHAQDEWVNMGLWDLVPNDGKLERIPHQPYLNALKRAQARINQLRIPQVPLFAWPDSPTPHFGSLGLP